MKKLKKSLATIVLGTILTTSNLHAGIPVVDGAQINQSIQNFIQNMNQNLKDYAVQAKNYALQAKNFIQEQTKGVSEVIGQLNDGLRWIGEQEIKMRNELQQTINGITDPITGAIKDLKLDEFTKLLRDGEKYYNDLVNTLADSEAAFTDVGNALTAIANDPKKALQNEKYKQLFGDNSTEAYNTDCTYRGVELKSCALKWGNRLSFVEGLTVVEQNLKNIENKSKHGLVQIAAKESKIVGAVSEATGGILSGTSSKEIEGTSEKQQLEANNVIADAQVAAQRQAVIAEQIEKDYQKREEQMQMKQKGEEALVKSFSTAEERKQQVEEIKRQLEALHDEIYKGK